MVYVSPKMIDDRVEASYYRKQYLDVDEKIVTFNNGFMYLKNLCTKITDGTHKTPDYKPEGIKFITAKNILEDGIDFEDVKYISKDEHNEISKRCKVEPGDMLFTKVGRIGYAKVVPANVPNFSIFVSVALLKLKGNVDSRFIEAFLNSKYGRIQSERLVKGSNQPDFHLEDIAEIKVPIPSPEIQKYIGDKVRKAEELREEAKRLKKEAEEILNRELNLNKLEESLKSSINSKHNWITSMDINDRIDSYYYKRRYILVNQHLNDYECIQIRDIASVDYGYMPTEDYADENNGVPLIRVTNMIGNLLLDLSDLKYISKSINIPDDKYVDDGDILVVQCGNTTGKIALMTKEVENYLYPSFCLRIKLRNKSINNKYLALLMEMSIIQEQIWQSASYSSVRPNTTKPAIENIRIPLIEKQKQEDVGALVEKYIDNIYQSKQLILEAKQDVEDLIEGNFDMSKVRANS